ncbi:MAG: SUF system NifU family Fe-S cluster assembly protein [Phycisphaeraceae bacterium]|nr:SUF system NifU family Fe-S cluster assembly protein [Phycisphaeraceae bacterium]
MNDYDLSELYQELILDHSKHPRNLGALADASHQAEGFNALCGDRVTVFLKLASGRVEGASFAGKGCAICTASASMMTEEVKGQTLAEVEKLFTRFHDLLTSPAEPVEDLDTLGRLASLAGVRRFPMRVKCATLPWHTLKAALDKKTGAVSTE